MARISLQQKEINRLVNYAKGLGITVILNNENNTSNHGAVWHADPPTIEIFTKNQSKYQIIMMFLHELGHHHDWLNNGRRDIQNAYSLEWERKKKDPPIPKDQRRIIYKDECRGINYMDKIAELVDLKTPPLWRIRAEMALDRWTYRHYYTHGDTPSPAQIKDKEKKLVAKYKELDKNG